MTDFCLCVCVGCEAAHTDCWSGCSMCDEYLCHSCNKYTSKNAKKNYLDMVGEVAEEEEAMNILK